MVLEQAATGCRLWGSLRTCCLIGKAVAEKGRLFSLATTWVVLWGTGMRLWAACQIVSNLQRRQATAAYLTLQRALCPFCYASGRTFITIISGVCDSDDSKFVLVLMKWLLAGRYHTAQPNTSTKERWNTIQGYHSVSAQAN